MGCKTFEGVEVVAEREDVSAFVFDLRVLRQLVNVLDENSLRRNKIIKGLAEIFKLIDAMPSEVKEEVWRAKLAEAREIMKPLLKGKNGDTVPEFGIVGYSHLECLQAAKQRSNTPKVVEFAILQRKGLKVPLKMQEILML